MNKKVYIRADGNAEMGLGHLVRCIALGQMLKSNFNIHFVCKYIPEEIIAELTHSDFHFTQILKEESFLKLINPKDIVVLDHYGLGSSFQQEIKRIGCSLVIGAAYPHLSNLKKIIAANTTIELYQNVNAGEMATLMRITTLAIIPASGVLLEAISSGCRIISGQYVQNQQYIYAQYKSSNTFIDGKDFSEKELHAAFKAFSAPSKQKDPIVFDGLSAERLLKLFMQLDQEKDMKIRLARETDTGVTLKWAQDKRIRNFSFSQNDINEEEHRGWFNSKINSEECIYFIVEYKTNIIGSIRFDILEGLATMSYLVVPDFRGMGLGISVLRKGIESFMNEASNESVRTVLGYVMPENIASLKAFERLGFIKEVEESNLKFTKYL